MVASPPWVPWHLMALIAAMLILLGLPGMFVRLIRPAGWPGLIGFVLSFYAVLMLGVIDMGLYTFGFPLFASIAPEVLKGYSYGPLPPTLNALYLVANLAFCVGVILFGRAVIRAAALPHEFDIIGHALIFAGLADAIATVVIYVPMLTDPLWFLFFIGGLVSSLAFFLAIGVCGGALMSRTEKAGPLIGRRLLVYGMLTTSIVMCYVLVVGSLGILVQQTRSTLIISLFLIGLIAILFQPLRDRLQRAVNRLVYGERDNPYAVLSQLGRHMEATLAPESVLPTIVETIARSLKLPYAAIALKQEDELTVAAAYGSQVETPLRFPLVYQGEQLGELVLSPRSPGEPLTPADQRLLHDLAPQIGVAVNAVRLTVDLQRSRERLVTTREEERRRLRRDLHDGLGPQLASQTLTLTAARKLLRDDPDAAEALLVNATVHVQEAITDIRRLVYDLRPPALDDLGLIAALREQIAQYQSSGVSFTLDVPDQLPELTAAVEVACYRIIQEALTNVVRHAHAHICTIHIALNGVLILEITDDGTGLAAVCRPSVGFSSMRERAEELGGSCVIESLPAGGTRVSAQLPR